MKSFEVQILESDRGSAIQNVIIDLMLKLSYHRERERESQGMSEFEMFKECKTNLYKLSHTFNCLTNYIIFPGTMYKTWKGTSTKM